jgi:hypothetical protein
MKNLFHFFRQCWPACLSGHDLVAVGATVLSLPFSSLCYLMFAVCIFLFIPLSVFSSVFLLSVLFLLFAISYLLSVVCFSACLLA